MTAVRVITDHQELDNAGQHPHDYIDHFINDRSFIVVSGTVASTDIHVGRNLVAGGGVVFTDNGPGQDFVISVVSASADTGDQWISRLEDGSSNVSSFRERVGFPFVDRLTWWDSPAKNVRMYQKELTRSVGSFLVTTMSYKQYDSQGNLIKTAIDTITYQSGVFEDTRTRVFI